MELPLLRVVMVEIRSKTRRERKVMMIKQVKIMKSIFGLLILFSACDRETESVSDQTHHQHSQEVVKVDNDKEVLQLNNGTKWNADNATKKNVDAILKV